MRRKIVGEIRRVRPDTVLCWDPTVWWINESMVNHPDHRAVAQAAVDAVFPSPDLVYLNEDFSREGLTPWQPECLIIFRFEGGDTFSDIEETLDLNIAAPKKTRVSSKAGTRALFSGKRLNGRGGPEECAMPKRSGSSG